MKPLKIAIAGLGTVGAEVARLLLTDAVFLADRAGRPLQLMAVSIRDRNRDRGLPSEALEKIVFADDPVSLADDEDVDVIIELMGGSEGPARSLVMAALEKGKAVVTANKALLAHHGQEIAIKAEAAGLPLLAEAAVAGGIPALKTLREGLAANRVRRVSGILNGTCNYILSTMAETGKDFDTVLADAQALGYAEADPSFDIDGVDAAHKLALLSAMAFGVAPDMSALSITGIRQVSAVDFSLARDIGYAVKLLAVAECEEDGNPVCRVSPAMVPVSAQLAKVDGALNAVEVEAEPVGPIVNIGAGAGAGPTASAVLADVIDIARGRVSAFFGMPAAQLARPAGIGVLQRSSRYYIRLTVEDRPGVLADVTAVLRDEAVSVEALLQHGPVDGDGLVSVVLTTHAAPETSIQAVLARLPTLDCVHRPPVAMPVWALG